MKAAIDSQFSVCRLASVSENAPAPISPPFRKCRISSVTKT